MKRRTRRTLKKELTLHMMLASACTLLSACAAVFYVFFSFFSRKTQEDIAYILRSMGQQYQGYMQFIEDSVVSVRHNTMLEDFFREGAYDPAEAKTQLSYSMELFSERNMVERQIPFVTGMYLFNREGDCVSEQYYATTIAARRKEEERYGQMQSLFREGDSQYACGLDETSVNILFRIYDDEMREKGTGIVRISREAVETVLSEAANYRAGVWAVWDKDEQVVLSRGEEELIRRLGAQEAAWEGARSLSDRAVIGWAGECGFGMRLMIAVGRENIFAILKPTLMIFLVGLILVLAVTLLVAYGASYRLTRPVTRMIDSIRAFGEQDLNARMADSSIQEFQDIGTVFNEMADRIKYLITQVYEKQLLATQSQVKYLQAQINPHFQFNILAMFSLKAKMAGNEELYQGLNAFSRLMQGKIFREREIRIRVKEELEIVRFYLYLQKSRYGDKLSYEIALGDERIGEDLIPRLLIEPLVENAVSHGLEPKKGAGRILVRLDEDEEERLHIRVEDDGVGIDPDKMEEKAARSGGSDHTHTGLENTRRMLQVLYEGGHELHIHSEQGKGTRIEIILPIERG